MITCPRGPLPLFERGSRSSNRTHESGALCTVRVLHCRIVPACGTVSRATMRKILGLVLVFSLALGGCGLFAVAGPWLAEAAVLISDAVNAVDAAEALLPSLHLDAKAEAEAEAAIGRCRAALAAAAAADDGAKDLTAEQLDASLAAFRTAWIDIQVLFASPHIGATSPPYRLPMPLAVKRAEK